MRRNVSCVRQTLCAGDAWTAHLRVATLAITMTRWVALAVLASAGCGARTGLSSGEAAPADAAVVADVAVDTPPIGTKTCRSNALGAPLRPAPPVAYALVETAPLYERASSVAIGDLTGDGRADVVAVHDSSAWVHVQQADGTLGAPLRIAEGGHAVALITVGGRPAFVVAQRDALVTFRVAASGALEVVHRTPVAEPYELTTGDIDGDGFVDVVASIRDSQSITTFLGDGSGAFPRQHTVRYPARAPIFVQGVVLADIDPTPGLELAVLLNEPFLGVMHRNAKGEWDWSLTTGAWTPAAYRALAVADMDGDGPNDLVLGARTLELLGPGAVVVRQTFTGAFTELPWGPSRRPRDTLAIAARDVDGDGQADFVAVVRDEDSVDSSLALFLGRGSSRVAGPIVPLGAMRGSPDVVVGDVDCDGCPDVIVYGQRVFHGEGCAP